MPSPKDIKNLLKATQGQKAGKAMDLEELLGTLPKGSKAQQLEAELMFKRLAEEQAARYAGHTPPTERGNAALSELMQMLAPKNPDINKAHGGVVHMAGGGKLLKALKGAEKAGEATQDIQSIVSAGKPLTAAERAMVGKLAEQYTAEQPVTRLSEALGNIGAEGKKLRVTQTDRTSARNLGGAPFSMMQKVDPRYAEAKATWGVKTPGAAKNITNQSDADVVWSTLIGSPTQHRSNELIFDKLYKAFQKSAKEGNLSAELRAKFNAALEPIFGEGADILNPKLRKEIDTFEKRAVVGNLLLGEGLGGAQRGGSIIPGMKIMSETTEPMLRDVETFSIGPRLFTLDQGVITRPDLHPAFPEILQGEDLNQLFTPVPNRIALPTFNEAFMARTGRTKPGYYDLTMTPPGQPYPTQFVDEDYLNFLQKEGYAHGGAVHMAGGGNPGDTSGEMFSPKPFTIPAPLTDMADAIKRQFSKEKRSMRKPGAATDVLLRGPVAFAAGTPMDLVEMAGQGVDYLQTRIPGLRKPASVMDTGPEKTPPMGYAPKVQVGPTGTMPYGTEDFQERLNQAGLTTGEERPLTEIGTAIASPFAAQKALKYGKAGAQALAPTARDILEMQLERATAPMRMSMVPEDGKVGKVKAPANPVGFYNPAEKAALNVQRKKGPGSAFVSDMKKQPGVNDERLAELGLGDLASRPNVTREEVLAAAEANRIPLRETVRRDASPKSEQLADEIDSVVEDLNYLDNDSREYAEMSRYLDGLKEQQKKLIGGDGPAMFGPRTHESYNMPGGENYREIRVGLPSNRPSIKNMSRDEYNAAVAKADREGVEDFTNPTHHGDEPNVLFHLRVADHTDVEGKKGLLIDELQSDWHQKGREKGYNSLPEGAKVTYNKDINKYVVTQDGKVLGDFAATEQDAIRSASRNYGGVPDAPFKDNWYQLGLKRAIKEAADSGMDRVYLTTGNRQIDRYQDALRANVDAIEYEPFKGENGELLFEIAGVKNGRSIIEKESLTYKELQELVGKDMAEKMKNNVGESLAKERPMRPDWMRLSGENISIGGEGMKQYYDKNYVNFLKKYAKQFDATVGETTLPGAAKTRDQLTSNDMHQMMDIPEFKKILDEEFSRFEDKPKITGRVEPQGNGDFKVVWDDGTFAGGYSEDSAKYRASQGKNAAAFAKEAWNAALKRFGGEKVYYIDITPKMKDSAAKGQSYKAGGAVKMAEGGQLTFAKANQLLQQHVAGMANGGAVRMAEGGAVDYESRFNQMLQKHVQGMAEGGAVKSIWTVN
jgi:hypothetical protein